LNFSDKELTKADLQDACNISLVSNIMSYEKDQIRDNETSSDISNGSTTLLINEIVDLEIEKYSESPIAVIAQAVLSEDLDYGPSN
ncbi:33681_t:CDS:1, partial [Racocetra persica]